MVTGWADKTRWGSYFSYFIYFFYFFYFSYFFPDLQFDV